MASPRRLTIALPKRPSEVMRNGGNAIDGAVVAGLTLSVVNGYNSGLGGGCFILVSKADGQVIAIDGRETAPKRATRDLFIRDGKADPRLSLEGALAVGTPGALVGLCRRR